MCLLVCLYKVVRDYPIVVGANRDEAIDRPGVRPQVCDEENGIVCPVDPRAGGTWLGVNRHGLFAALTDRPTPDFDAARRSRGLLCLDSLRYPSVAESLPAMLGSCRRWPYNCFNLLLADAREAAVLQYDGTPRGVRLEPGVHVLANADVDDLSIAKVRRAFELLADVPNSLPAAVEFLKGLCSDHEEGRARHDQICVHGDRFATLSSIIVALHASEAGRSVFLHAPSNPCRSDYEHFERLLMQG